MYCVGPELNWCRNLLTFIVDYRTAPIIACRIMENFICNCAIMRVLSIRHKTTGVFSRRNSSLISLMLLLFVLFVFVSFFWETKCLGLTMLFSIQPSKTPKRNKNKCQVYIRSQVSYLLSFVSFQCHTLLTSSKHMSVGLHALLLSLFIMFCIHCLSFVICCWNHHHVEWWHGEWIQTWQVWLCRLALLVCFWKQKLWENCEEETNFQWQT